MQLKLTYHPFENKVDLFDIRINIFEIKINIFGIKIGLFGDKTTYLILIKIDILIWAQNRPCC